MYVELSCSKCGESSLVSFSALYGLWKKGYKTLKKKNRRRAKVCTEIACYCGHVERYDGPMFKYIFQLIFDELIQEEEV